MPAKEEAGPSIAKTRLPAHHMQALVEILYATCQRLGAKYPSETRRPHSLPYPSSTGSDAGWDADAGSDVSRGGKGADGSLERTECAFVLRKWKASKALVASTGWSGLHACVAMTDPPGWWKLPTSYHRRRIWMNFIVCVSRAATLS